MPAPDEREKDYEKEEMKLKMSCFAKGYFPWRPAASSGAVFSLRLISKAAPMSALVQDWHDCIMIVAIAGGRGMAPLARSGVGHLRQGFTCIGILPRLPVMQAKTI